MEHDHRRHEPGTVAGRHGPSAHIRNRHRRKTGSAQIVSLALRAKHQNNTDFAQNGWFVGSRRGAIRTSSCVFSSKAANTENWRRVWRPR